MTDLDARYGRRPARARAIAVWAAAAALVVAALAWFVWANPLGLGGRVDWRDTAYRILGADEVEMSWELTVDPGLGSSCAVYAMNELFGIVGWKVVEIPASDRVTRELTDTVRTTEPAVTGLVYRCWLS